MTSSVEEVAQNQHTDPSSPLGTTSENHSKRQSETKPKVFTSLNVRSHAKGITNPYHSDIILQGDRKMSCESQSSSNFLLDDRSTRSTSPVSEHDASIVPHRKTGKYYMQLLPSLPPKDKTQPLASQSFKNDMHVGLAKPDDDSSVCARPLFRGQTHEQWKPRVLRTRAYGSKGGVNERVINSPKSSDSFPLINEESQNESQRQSTPMEGGLHPKDTLEKSHQWGEDDITLEKLVFKHAAEFPLRIKVVKGCTPIIRQEDVLNVHFLKKSKVL